MKKILFFMLLVVCGALASSCEGKTGQEKIDCEYEEKIAKAKKEREECEEQSRRVKNMAEADLRRNACETVYSTRELSARLEQNMMVEAQAAQDMLRHTLR